MTDKPSDEKPDPAPAEPPGGAAPGEKGIERRAFFTEGFRSLMKPLSRLVETRLEHFNRAIDDSRRAARRQLGPAQPQVPSYSAYGGALASRLLRPPGALEESFFADRCARSAQCVTVCPVQAIQLLESDDPMLSGTPFIDPQTQACVVCEDLSCMKVCPTGALQSVPRHLIHMGLAEVHEEMCLRTGGDDCRICVEKCPLGAEAIHIPTDGGPVEVKEDGCIGCGVCEMECPTNPRAIVIKGD